MTVDRPAPRFANFSIKKRNFQKRYGIKNWIMEFLVVTEPGKYSKVIWVEA